MLPRRLNAVADLLELAASRDLPAQRLIRIFLIYRAVGFA